MATHCKYTVCIAIFTNKVCYIFTADSTCYFSNTFHASFTLSKLRIGLVYRKVKLKLTCMYINPWTTEACRETPVVYYSDILMC